MNYSHRKKAETSEILFKSTIIHARQPSVLHAEAGAQIYQNTINKPGANQQDFFIFKHIHT